MQGSSWIGLLRRLPVHLHDGLMLTLTTGSEVVVQRFVKLEPDFAILRGRMAGTQDNGRIVLLPWSMLVAVNVTRALKEQEIEAIFGVSSENFAANSVSNGDTSAPPQQPEPPPEEPVPNGVAEEPAPAKPAMPSKTELLKKLRARLGDPGRSGT